MGNRCVITTARGENVQDSPEIGVYLHWNGGRDSVEGFLKYCKLKRFRPPEEDCYGWASLVHVITNFFGGRGLDIGIDQCRKLDCNNGDNGVYQIANWEIVGRQYMDGPEQKRADQNAMLLAIDAMQPADEQIAEYLLAEEVPREDVEIGDEIVEIDWRGRVVSAKVVGIGGPRMVNGQMVRGIPYANLYNNDHPEENINNYFRDKILRRKAAKFKRHLMDPEIEKLFPDWRTIQKGCWSVCGKEMVFGDGRRLYIGMYREPNQNPEYADTYTLQILDGDAVIFCHQVDLAENS